MEEEKYIEIILNSIVYKKDKFVEQPSKILLYNTHAEFYLDFKFTNKFKIDNEDEFMDKIAPKYEVVDSKIKETIFIDKNSILCFNACEEDAIDDLGKIGIVEINGITTDVSFVLKSYEEAQDFITKLKNWKYERS
jgi:hypothetical protein